MYKNGRSIELGTGWVGGSVGGWLGRSVRRLIAQSKMVFAVDELILDVYLTLEIHKKDKINNGVQYGRQIHPIMGHHLTANNILIF